MKKFLGLKFGKIFKKIAPIAGKFAKQYATKKLLGKINFKKIAGKVLPIAKKLAPLVLGGKFKDIAKGAAKGAVKGAISKILGHRPFRPFNPKKKALGKINFKKIASKVLPIAKKLAPLILGFSFKKVAKKVAPVAKIAGKVAIKKFLGLKFGKIFKKIAPIAGKIAKQYATKKLLGKFSFGSIAKKALPIAKKIAMKKLLGKFSFGSIAKKALPIAKKIAMKKLLGKINIGKIVKKVVPVAIKVAPLLLGKFKLSPKIKEIGKQIIKDVLIPRILGSKIGDLIKQKKPAIKDILRKLVEKFATKLGKN